MEFEVISPDSHLHNNNNNNNNTMTPIPLANEKSLGTGDLPVSENQKPRTTPRAIIPFLVATLLVLGYYFTTPILSACSPGHKKLTVQDRAIGVLSENPLIGTELSSNRPFAYAYQSQQMGIMIF